MEDCKRCEDQVTKLLAENKKLQAKLELYDGIKDKYHEAIKSNNRLIARLKEAGLWV